MPNGPRSNADASILPPKDVQGSYILEVNSEEEIVCCSERVANSLGLASEELIGQSLESVVTFSSRESGETEMGVLAHAIFHESWEQAAGLNFATACGRRFRLLNVVPEREGDRVSKLKLCYEPVEARTIELAEDRELLEATARMAQIGGWELDCRSGRVRWTAQTFRIHELPPGDTLHLEEALAFYTPDSREILEPAIQRTVATGEPYDLELEIVSARGNLRFTKSLCRAIYENGEVVKLQGTYQDITERRETEDALSESEARYRDIFDNSTAIKFLIDPRTGRIVEANPAAVSFYGYSVADISELTVFDLNAATKSEVQQKLQNACDSQCVEYEFQHVLASGEVRDVNVHAGPVRVKGQVLVYSVVFDVTERKRAEQNLLRMQQFQSLGTLAAGIAHDFNNVLTAVFGNVSVAKEMLPSSHKATAYLENAESAIDRATSLSKQLLTFAKGGKPVCENVSVRRLISEVVNVDLSVRRVEIECSLEAGLWSVHVDRGQLQQVFSNLAINAADSMLDCGVLRISARNTFLSSGEFPNVAAGSYVAVQFRDEGAGIPPEDVKRIFEPYFSTKPNGTGLGLTTCYSIINQHGGHLELTSKVGVGSTFTVFLPTSGGNSPEAYSQNPVAPPPPGERSIRVLLMDDEEAILDVAKGILTMSGAEVTACRNVDDSVVAYVAAQADDRQFDVVILDLTINGGPGGEQAASRILKVDPKANLICSSGYTDAEVMSKYEQFGFKAVIAKPYTAAELRDVVDRFACADLS